MHGLHGCIPLCAATPLLVIPSRADNASPARTEESHKRWMRVSNREIPRIRSG